MINSYATSDTAIADAVATLTTARGPQDIPPAVVEWLARLRVLLGVPFAYLVPHQEMLPQESIRFFYINRNWLDAAVDGALSLGSVTTRDRAHLESVYPALRAEADKAERNLWASQTGAPLHDGAAEVVTGFLLRSSVVSGWPALQIRGYRTVDEQRQLVQLLRVERLAPAVLLVLMDGIPDSLEIEEPRGSAQLGVDTATGAPNARSITLRDPATGQNIEGATLRVPFRENAPGVVDVTALRQRILAQNRPEIGPEISPAEFAQQLVQYPARQEFTETGPVPDVFRATIPIEVVRASHGGA